MRIMLASNSSAYYVLPTPVVYLARPVPLNVDTVKRKVEAFASSFFSHRQRSKVIARVTQNSLGSFRAYLALRGCDRAPDKFVYD